MSDGTYSNNETGTYNFLIQNDTLKFTTISDTTSSRVRTMSTCHWVRIQTGIKRIDFISAIKFYMNTFSSSTTLKIDKPFNSASLTVYNSIGLQVKQINIISGQTITLNRDNLPNGVYFIRLTLDNKTFNAEKLIIVND